MMCIATFLQIAAFILFNSVSGTGAVRMVVFIESLTLAIYTVYVYVAIMVYRVSPAMAWTAEILYQAVTIILCLSYLASNRWRNKQL